ncbi:MAG TPA: hypothetical protein VGP56_01790, partial [Gaiellaceae bacterium]|nr:hypothetical protein [Gaiellaceae bacterium]
MLKRARPSAAVARLGIEESAASADLDVRVRGPALQNRRYAAPVVLSLLAAALMLAGAAIARPYGAPRNVSAPKISGHVVVGRTISASHGRWTGSPKRFRYAWQRCGRQGRNCRTFGRVRLSTG